MKKVNEKEKWRLKPLQFKWIDNTLRKSLWEQIARMRASVKLKPSDCAPSSLCPPPTRSTNVSSPSSSASITAWVPKITSPLNCSWAFRTHSTTSFSAASKLWTCGGSRDALLSTTPSSTSNAPSSKTPSSSAKVEVLPTSISSSESFLLMNDVANELLHGGFTYSFLQIPNYLISSLTNLSATISSACIFKDTMRNDNKVFLKSKTYIFEICSHPLNFNFTS